MRLVCKGKRLLSQGKNYKMVRENLEKSGKMKIGI